MEVGVGGRLKVGRGTLCSRWRTGEQHPRVALVVGYRVLVFEVGPVFHHPSLGRGEEAQVVVLVHKPAHIVGGDGERQWRARPYLHFCFVARGIVKIIQPSIVVESDLARLAQHVIRGTGDAFVLVGV